jgi:RNA polymerase sigma factor (sigma-70 family)
MKERSSRKGDSPSPGDILHRLNSPDAGPAWSVFIDRYSPLILKAARQFEYEQDRVRECFLFVCEKLYENNFQRLLKFNTEGKARFRTWLGSVVFNLCVDWHRSEFGRVELLPAIGALPAFDQAVYRLHFERGMDRDTCFRNLREEFPDLTQKQMADAMARVHQVLTPRQRWRMGVRNHALKRRTGTSKDVVHIADSAEGPEDRAGREQQARQIARALAQLPAEKRLAIQLRFEQGLTLKKVAELMNLGDPFRARRKIQAALDELSQLLPEVQSKKF